MGALLQEELTAAILNRAGCGSGQDSECSSGQSSRRSGGASSQRSSGELSQSLEVYDELS